MNINEFLKQYIDLPKWRGKIFTDDEMTCYMDGLHEGSKVMQDENEQLKKRVSHLENDLMVARKDREDLKEAIANGLEEFMKDNPMTSLQMLANKKDKEENERLSKRVLELQSDVSNLKLYIEKMKSCYNCKYYNAGSTRCFTGIPYNSKGCLKHWVLR